MSSSRNGKSKIMNPLSGMYESKVKRIKLKAVLRLRSEKNDS